MRNRISKSCISALIAGLAIHYAAPSLASGSEVLNFRVLKDGEPIGYETVEITPTATGQTVTVKTLTNVQVLFLKFHYDHQRTEQWQGGKLVSVETTTNDDGTHYTWQASYDADCYMLSGKGVGKRDACDAAWPLTLWQENVTGKTNLYSVINAEPYVVRTDKVGKEPVLIEAGETPATRYTMSGDVERDLWYGTDGKLLKTSFKRKGYDIDFIRVDANTLQK
ncbi:hypothetical protein DYI21_15895 [Thalassospira tepidiphila]|jgi:hypothetical protein|uniref:DUF6134 family protein n=1 Tax=Thalassospira tepidiphila TaxID=393657 RepID=UPI001BD0A3BE|nr:DUF6134 family protein [Thalassospira tepidiphila]MBS8275074.1 hypothetical protein [Thalassospira tepidiphila]